MLNVRIPFPYGQTNLPNSLLSSGVHRMGALEVVGVANIAKIGTTEKV